MPELKGEDFVALVRLSNGADQTIAAIGETCEKVPAAKSGGTASEALVKLLASGLIAPAKVKRHGRTTSSAPAAPVPEPIAESEPT